MSWEWLALSGLLVVVLGLVVTLARLRGRTRRELAAAQQEAAALRDRLDRLEERPAAEPTQDPRRERPVPAPDQEYRITRVGEPDETGEEPARLERAVFADLLLRESVVRLGSVAHGVRRALSAESRNRIRFEMKREVKRARKQRRADQRAAYREWQARQRDLLTDEDLRESA